MSVTEVIAQLRRAHALLAEARQATTQADAAISHGATVFATATEGSTQPEVAQINRLAARSGEDVRAADALFSQTQDLIDGYCQQIAGQGIGGGAGTLLPIAISPDESLSRPPPNDPPTPRESSDPEVRYAEEIAELRRNGRKISPEKVVRVARHQQGHLVWLEEGDIEVRGKAHILRPDRADKFNAKGVPTERVVDLIFAGIEHGEHIGYSGRDREAYEVVFDGKSQRFAVLISTNGYIVTAHPLHTDGRKDVRPHKHRRP